MKNDLLFLRANNSLNKIIIPHIVYIEAMDDYVKINFKDHKSLLARITMQAILEKLPPKKFIRVHRSYIVPVANITALGAKKILLNDLAFPLGSSYSKGVSEAFKRI